MSDPFGLKAEHDRIAAMHMVPSPKPPPPDPNPNASYVALLEAARGAGPAMADLVELHKAEAYTVGPDGAVGMWVCRGDDFSGYEGEEPYWPCRTAACLAAHLGVVLE